MNLPTESLLQKNLRIVEKHLERNKNWIQSNDYRIHTFEKNAEQWNEGFLQEMEEIEKILKDLEQMFED